MLQQKVIVCPGYLKFFSFQVACRYMANQIGRRLKPTILECTQAYPTVPGYTIGTDKFRMSHCKHQMGFEYAQAADCTARQNQIECLV